MNLGIAGGSIVGATSGRSSAQAGEKKRPSGPTSRVVDIDVQHDVSDDVPITESDTFRMFTYLSNQGVLYYVSADRSEYVPGRPLVRTPSELTHQVGQETTVRLGETVDADLSGAYKREIGVESYSIGDASVAISKESTDVEIGDRSVTLNPGDHDRFELASRTIEVPTYGTESVPIPYEGYSGEKETTVKTGSKSVEVTPIISVTDHGPTTIVGEMRARVFPETMPGANAIWHSSKGMERKNEDGTITISKGRND